jgi:hypothetical protein
MVVGLVGGIVATVFLVGFWLATTDRPFPERFAVGLFPLALVLLCFGGVAYIAQPVSYEVDEKGVRQYWAGRLWSDLPWDRVAWVAYGHWSVAVSGGFARKTALCLLIRGPHIRKSIGIDDATYNVTSAEVTDFATTVVELARSRAIRILPQPRF